jgi:hypothetical protein
MKIFALVLLVAVAACPKPTPTGGVVGKVVDCSVQGVRDNALQLVPLVNDCLTGGGWTGCLLGLIKPAVGITEDVIACVVQSSESSYARAARTNPGDTVSTTAAQNASRFLLERGYKFTTPTAPASGVGSAGAGGGG